MRSPVQNRFVREEGLPCLTRPVQRSRARWFQNHDVDPLNRSIPCLLRAKFRVFRFLAAASLSRHFSLSCQENLRFSTEIYDDIASGVLAAEEDTRACVVVNLGDLDLGKTI